MPRSVINVAETGDETVPRASAVLRVKPEGYAWLHAAAGEPFFMHIGWGDELPRLCGNDLLLSSTARKRALTVAA